MDELWGCNCHLKLKAMKKLFNLILITLFAIVANAQDSSSIRKVILTTWIRDMHNIEVPGFLHSITDSAIYLMHYRKPAYSEIDRSQLMKMNPELIKSVTMRRKGAMSKGLGIGLLSGIAVGAVIGLASYKDPGPEAWFDLGPGFSALGGAMIGGVVGGLVGVGVSASSAKYKINGSKDNFRSMRLHIYKRLSKRGVRNPLN